MYNAAKGNNISSDTSDPSTAHMRVFVGNINTSAIDKQKLQEIFRKYGFVTGISIHRGFAFVQYNSQAAARKAAQHENGSTITDQRADVNIAAEPKPNQKPFSSGNMPGSFDGSTGALNEHCSSTPSPISMHPHQLQQPVVRGVRPQVGGVSSSTSSRGGKSHHGNHHGGGHHHHYHQQQQQHNNKNFHHHHHHHPNHINHARFSNNKVHNGRIVKNTNSNPHKSSFSKSNAAKTLSVVNLSAVRKELLEIREKIDSLLTVITKSGGIGIDQSQITFEMDQQAQQLQQLHYHTNSNNQHHTASRDDSPMMTPSSGGEPEPSPQRRHAAVGTTDCEIATTTTAPQVVKEEEERESTPTAQQEEQQEMVEEFTAKEEDDMSTVEEVVGIDSN